MHHPVHFRVEAPEGPRNRLTTFFRPLLVLPHALLVGGPAVALVGGGYHTGVLGLLALSIALLDWFSILFRGKPLDELRYLKRLYLDWRARVLAYAAFLRDEYPPFDQRDYPVTLQLPQPPAAHDRLSVLLRPIFVLPHLLVMAVLMVAWVLVALVTWAWISVTGRHPLGLWRFGRDVMAYSLRVESYLLLMHDEFPPFLLSDEPEAVVDPHAV